MRRVVFGGSFDPVHAGHLQVAEEAGRALGADRVSFVPAALSPHKPAGSHATPQDRLAMVRLAIAGNPFFDALDVDVRRGGRSFTYDMLRELLDGPCKGDQLVLLLGQDALADLHRWHRAREMAALVPIAVVPRPGAPEPRWDLLEESLGKPATDALRTRVLPVARSPVSSTAVRTRLAEGKSIRCWVPDPVVDYIEANGLYR